MTGKTDCKTIPDAFFPGLCEYLTAKIGLHFSDRNRNELHLKMSAAMKEFGYENVGEFIAWLLSSSPTQKQIEILASHLTVGETYFFREMKAFEFLERSILPGLIDERRRTGKRLRIWSAGCATGEEPYSVAILLAKLIPDLQDWNITILATDINTVALRKAHEGIYSDWSFRDVPSFFKDKYFEKANGNRYLLLPDIKNMVTFSYLNLSQDVYPSLQSNTNAMDVIFCRNVLMYFTSEHIKAAAERFYRSLVDGGFLIVSPVETSHIHYAQFDTIRIKDSTFYKRDPNKAKVDRIIVQYVEKEMIPHPLPSEKVKYPKSGRPSHVAVNEGSIKQKQSVPITLEEATALYRKGLYKEAEESLRALVSNGDSSQKMLILFTKILANQGKLEDAFRCCKKAVSAEKFNPHLRYLLAIILEEQKKVQEARASLKKALYLDHNFVLAHFALANLSLRMGQHEEARKSFLNTSEILSKCKPEEILPDSDGITAGMLSEIIHAIPLGTYDGKKEETA